jgi:hypothetical protein
VFTVAAVLVALTPHDGPTVTTTDIVEVNHYHDDEGRKVFDQIIWWEWLGGAKVVRDWRLLKSPHQIPQQRNGWYESTWWDGETLRRVRAKAYKETWTYHDPEVANREFWPKEKRTNLTKGR